MAETLRRMAQPEEVPQEAGVAGPLSDVRLLADVLTGIIGDSIGVGTALLRGEARGSPGLRSRVLWRPVFIPERLQPASLLAAGARRGQEHRARAFRQIESLLDTVTQLVADELLTRLDLDAIVDQVDIAALVEEVLTEIDLPSIIRESTGSVASESVRGARMTGMLSATPLAGRWRSACGVDLTCPGRDHDRRASCRHPTGVSPCPGGPAAVGPDSLRTRSTGIVVGLALAGGYAGYAALRLMSAPRDFRMPDPSLLWTMTIYLLVAEVYLTAAWWLSGRTYGDHVMGIRVIDAGRDPGRPSAGAVSRRLLCRVPRRLAVVRHRRPAPSLPFRTSCCGRR